MTIESVAVCGRGRSRQRIGILDLPLPDPLPDGAEWVEAYRRWARGPAGVATSVSPQVAAEERREGEGHSSPYAR
jgi:hypothetical protein